MKHFLLSIQKTAKLGRLLKRTHAQSSTKSYESEYKRSIERPEEYWAEKKGLIQWHKQPVEILDKTSSGRW
jgi:hypothetical protein